MSTATLEPPTKTEPVEAAAAAIDARGVVYRYGDRAAVDGVSLRVGVGEIVGLLGPNGSGKTTLFRVLCTGVGPAEGAASIFGLDVVRDRDAVRRALGVVFQNPSLDGELTARENLRHHGHLYGLGGADLKRRIAAALDRADLVDRADDRTKTFSGGMRRRLELAMAVLHGPRLLLLDEPSTGLDPAARLDWWRAVSGLRDAEGMTVLFTTHLMDEAERCDRLVMLDRGRVIADDSPAALRGAVGGEVVRLHGRDLPALARRLAAEGIEAERVEDELRIERPDGRSLVGQLAEKYPDLIDFAAVGRPTLDDAFVRLTGRKFEA